MRRFLLLALAAVLATPLAAQKAPKPIEPPKLDTRADPNDAESYMEYGRRKDVSWKKTLEAFQWAQKLQPDDIGILAMVQQAFWYRQPPQWRSEYWQDAAYVMKSKEAKFLDSLRYEVAIRNPMYYLRGPCYRLPGIEGHDDDWEAASFLFDYGCYKESAARYAKAIARHPRVLGMRMTRAHALYRSGQFGEAVTELQTVLDTLRSRDRKYLAHQYESRAIIEFMIATAHLRMSDTHAAREAYGRALTEDLSLYWVHARLAELALSENDTRTAIAEYEQAVALKENDGVLLHDYGVALSAAGQFAEAEPHFRRAIELEPHFSTAYYNLAMSLDRQDKRAEARTAYDEFLHRAPRRQTKMIITTHARMKALAEPVAVDAGPVTP
jgi:tetratricopeptide (TPR) repeat protein